MRVRLVLIAALVGVAGVRFAAQPATPQPAATPPAAAPQRPHVRSPLVEAGRVTFSVYAPKAAAISVRSGELDRLIPGPKPMTRAENGVWSLTVGPVPPGIYDYSFDVDGVVITDPESTNVFGNVRGSRGFVEVPGANGEARLDEWRDVAHGAITAQWYESKVTGARRRVHVYTPPGYYESSRRYPVLYLLHGAGDNDSHWSLIGRANVIADNLIAGSKAEPMIIVMPDGQTYQGQPNEAREVRSRLNAERMEADLLQHVMPLVERTYRVQRDRSQRAITGLSMGGGQSLFIGFRNPDRFAWIGGFSSSPVSPSLALSTLAPQANAFNDRVRLLWIRIGKDDFLLPEHNKFIDALKAAGIRHEYTETAGAHMWSVWRQYLGEFLPRLFRTT
jgi:enterochelin esterase-like enzyme